MESLKAFSTQILHKHTKWNTSSPRFNQILINVGTTSQEEFSLHIHSNELPATLLVRLSSTFQLVWRHAVELLQLLGLYGIHCLCPVWQYHILYSRKAGQGINLELNLKLKSANISYSHIYVWRSHTELPNLDPPVFLQWWFWAQPPNLIPANISESVYTVVEKFHGRSSILQMINLYHFAGLSVHSYP